MSDATQLTYLDFDLALEALTPTAGGTQTYRARVLNSPAGQAMVDFTLPFNPYELENYILKIGRTRRTVRSLNSQEGQAARDFGERLYNAVFKDEMRDALRRSLDKADGQADHGLRIRLRLGDAPALLDLPWEYLYDPTLRRFFCHSTTTPLVRYPHQPRPVTPLTVALPLQVLVLIANPSDVAALDVEGEWHKIEAAVAGLRDRGLIQLTRLENGTLAALQRQLRQGRYHIFHFVGHGGLNGLTGERVLYLEDERGRAHAVGGDHLGTLLSDHRSLRLALLNACEGARATTNDPFAGIAQQLVHQGIPAVIAMQFEITDGAALILAQEFYGALADGYPVEAALAEARKAIFVAGNDVEWGTPVLYSRANDGLLFKVDAGVAHLPGRGDNQSGKPEDPPAPSRKIDEPPADALVEDDKFTGIMLAEPPDSNVSITARPSAQQGTNAATHNLGVVSRAVTMTTTRWRRPGMLAMLFIGVALLGLLISSPRLVSMLNQGANGGTPAATTALLATSAQEVAVEPLSSVTPTPSIMPDAAATTTVIAGVTAAAEATETAAANRLATNEAATLESVSTATLTATPRPPATPSPTPQPTHTATVAPTPTPTPADGDQLTLDAYPMTFVYVSAGTFTMGSPDGEGADDERPQHEMPVDAFWIGLTEVTHAQYKYFVDAGGYEQEQWWTEAGWQWKTENKITQPYYWDDEQWNSAQQPVVGVSWYEATAYATWLAAETSLALRLPTEAEWEKAARGVDGRTYPWGDDVPTNQLLNYNGNLGRTVDVGSYPAGASLYGALDMAGNVWEWTATQWVENYDNYVNIVYNSKEGNVTRTLRGGSWSGDVSVVRSANRSGSNPDNRGINVGFRVVFVPGG